ncbi:MAG: phage major capsid protein [Clostridia bacterium]|nr:phage major capsid protein [Clostridia bacterium]
MKKCISLFDLCPIRPGMQKNRAARITAMSYLRDCPDKERHMEKQLLNTGEYILLRGKDSYSGLLRMVETNPVNRITGQAITELYNSVPKAYRKNAVFLMNTVTLNELSRSLGLERNLISCRDDGTFTLMDKPIVLCNAMPFISEGSVPILFGDFSKVSIEDCGRDELQEEPYDSNPDSTQCTLTGYMDCMLEEQLAIRGIKIV